MAARLRFDVLGISSADTTIRSEIPIKPCTAVGCSGTMYLNDPMEPPPPPTHLEFPSFGSWVCADDPTHVELLTSTACLLARLAHRRGRQIP